MILLLATGLPAHLVRLAPIDVAIVVFYFVLVLSIGWYLKGRANTGEDFFMAGREMTAWVAGLSFLSANLGALELMGWAGSAYQYGILATHWYWIGAIPAMLFLALVMMPFYYISKTHSVPGYLQLRFGEPSRALSAVSFAFMTVLMSGVPNRRHLRNSRRPALRHLQRSVAILSHLGRRSAHSYPRLV
jgi:SSS family solute:Na+ symporter